MLKAFVFEVNAQALKDTEVRWGSYAEAAELAEDEQKKVMIFLEAEWCTVCKRMHREVFTNEEIISLLNNDFYSVRIDIESDERISVREKMITKKEFSKSVGIYGTPTILFLNSEEEVIGNYVGFLDVIDMIRLLNYIESDAYLTESLESYLNP
jgi:thioredoxin-related protein